MRQPILPYSRHRHADPVAGVPALEVSDLRVVYPRTQELALQGINLSVPVGGRVALVGHNGAGKSTLLKTVAGLLTPRRGQIRVFGLKVGQCHHRTAYLPQRGEIDWRFPITVRRLIITGRYVHLGWLHPPNAHDYAIAERMIEAIGLTALADRQIGQLSGGQQQRALLARALTQEADLLLLDEPFTAVDAASREVIMRVLDEIRQQGKTALIATHDLSRLTTDFDGVLEMVGGMIENETGVANNAP